ncbi:MAG TPA: MATE family efflux transporter [Clostridia bacterium]
MGSTRLEKFKKTFIGDRAFYTAVVTLMLPIVIQNAITHFINLLDNIMIGQVGNSEMSGVSIANQLLFVFNLAVFGGLSGAGVFCAQFFGAKDHDNLRYTLRFKLWTIAIIFAVAITIFLTCGDRLIMLYLTGEGEEAERTAMFMFAKQYLAIMLWGLLPFCVSQAYGSTLRETGETVLPMRAGIVGILTNLCLNYLLIYGKLGFPRLGVEGAAIATVISRFVEMAIITIYAHKHSARFPFFKGLYKSFKIPKALTLRIFKKGSPLLLNELFWSFGITTITQIFSTRGLMVVGALNITSTVTNFFNVFMYSMGAAVAVMIGQALGANEIERAKETVWKLIFLNICICGAVSCVLAATSPFIPYLYKTTDQVRELASSFMRTHALYMIFNAISNSSYFTMRSGGKMLLTVLFDSVYTWVIFVPFTYVLTRFTALGITALYTVCYLTDILKAANGLIVVKSGVWAQNMVSKQNVVVETPQMQAE